MISNSVGEETNERLTSQNVILKNGRGHHRKFMPYVFTRNGIGMLSSVLRSETAADVNIRIMRAFTAIPDIVNNKVHTGTDPLLCKIPLYRIRYNRLT